MSTISDKAQRKRIQNKVSQRKHRARQAARVATLEAEVASLRKKLDNSDRLGEENLEKKVDHLKRQLEEAHKFVTALESLLSDALGRSVGSGISQDNPEVDRYDSEPCTKSPSTIISVSSSSSLNLNEFERIMALATQVHAQATFWQEFAYPNPSTTFGRRSIRSQFEMIEMNFLRLFAGLKLDVKRPDFMLDADLLNLVAHYAEQYLEVIPRLQNYTFALGGTKWLCGQLLLACFIRAKCKSLGALVCNGELSIDPAVVNLRARLIYGLEERIQVGAFEQVLQLLFPCQARAIILPEDPVNVVMPSYFKPTERQMSYIRDGIDYDPFFNFVIWPEFRDFLIDRQISLGEAQTVSLIEELMDNVVLKIDGKVFFMKHLVTIAAKKGSFARLINHGVTQPWCWKMSQSYGKKYSEVVPKTIVSSIDDTVDDHILKV